MDKGYIAPETALKKLRAARSLGQTVYIYGATGYGKTELVKQYLKSRRYQYHRHQRGIREGAETDRGKEAADGEMQEEQGRLFG